MGNTVPLSVVLSQTSRCVSSRISEPSVPVISIQVEEKFGYPGGRAVDRLHDPVCPLRINPYRFRRLHQPEHEIEVVRCLHGSGRQFHPARDLLAQAAREVPADYRAHRSPERAVDDLLLGVRIFGIEAL